MRRFSIVALLVLLSASCANKKSEPAVTPPPLLIEDRGTTMPLEKAVTHIAFRAYIPSSQVLGVAVLPPLGGPDIDKNRGIGIEYLAGHDAMLLSQWPKQRFNIAFGHGETAVSPCVPTHYSERAVAWTTPGELVMSLQPDGAVSPAAVDREARRLVRAGACR